MDVREMRFRGERLELAGGPSGYLERWIPATEAGTWEPKVLELFVRSLEVLQPDEFLDLGAYIGFYSLLASKWLPTTSRVIAVEPDRQAREWLMFNCRRNAADNVEPFDQCIGGSDGNVHFHHTGDSRSHVSQEHGEATQCVALDEFCTQIGASPSVVKVDIEGAEAGFMGDFPEILRSAQFVIMELHPGSAGWLACSSPPTLRSFLDVIGSHTVVQQKSPGNLHIVFGPAAQEVAGTEGRSPLNRKG